MSGYVLFDSLLAPYIITDMDIKQLKNIVQTTFPGLSINNFSILGDGKYAYACLVNDKIVFSAFVYLKYYTVAIALMVNISLVKVSLTV